MHEDFLLWALPVFVPAMAFEWAWGRRRGRDSYGWADTLNSLAQGLLSQAVAALTPLLQTGIYAWVQPRVQLHVHLLPAARLATPLGWVMAVVCYDFCDYWLHRVSHDSALFWAAHAVHHQSEHFNLSTALRQESFYPVMGFPFFLPLAVLGFSTEQFIAAGLVVLLYQFWIHTEHIGRLGWLDRVFSTPSNHRVHHAVNPGYLDRNYGAVLVVWDRLFGTFAEEAEPCVYGTVKPLASWQPLWAVAQFYAEIAQRMAATPRWLDRLRVPFKSPGWLPPGVEAEDPQAAARRLAQPRFDPPLPPAARAWAGAVFIACVAATGSWLLQADALAAGIQWAAGALLAVALWCMGRCLRDAPRRWLPGLGGVALGLLVAAGLQLVTP
ncbi:sterol desaturase family protein [Pelomonas sp. KK5]|uniref:sterol desaturase family protein n=1 Tax=Pelomonas sp. KK5 TaxID=1855730 RepID=UPI00097CA761|nr:sterol desaturase family protein [Pelomonas sp. KK5]